MATEITMPELSPSMTEANLVRWLKQDGDPVEVGDVLLEIETDKALVDFEAPARGTLTRVMVPAGTLGVKVGTTLAWLLQAGEAVPDGPSGARQDALVPQPGIAQVPGDAAPSAAAAPESVSGRIASSPLARRLARQHGLSLAAIRGSGPRGRIVQVDIESALRSTGPRPTRDGASHRAAAHTCRVGPGSGRRAGI